MLQDDVWSYCTSLELLVPGTRVVVAVSGGSDSVALLRLLCSLRESCHLDVVCAHFNHQLRGAESDADEAFVRGLAGSLNVPCETGSDNVGAYASEHHLSLEEAARELRLRFLRMTALKTGAACIATAHTQDDQAETVLFRLLKGTGLRGMSGMAPRAGMFIHPLLGVSKEQLQGWLRTQGFVWREDLSNADERYERNFIRTSVIPLIESRFPAVKTAVARTSNMARATCELFERQTEQVTDNIEILEAGDGRHPGALRLAKGALASLPDPLLQYALEEIFATSGVGPSFERLTRSTQAIRNGRTGVRVTLDDRVTLEVGYQHVYVYGAAFTGRAQEPQEIAKFPATVDWFRRRLTFEEKTPVDVPSDLRDVGPKEAWFDVDTLRLPLTVRHARPGDRMTTFGGHQHKLQDLYVDAKVDRVLRARRPVVCDADGIIWVPALARSAAGVVTVESRRFLRIVYYSSQC
ncbi:tRNA lysidine(34) synthetase TilS [Candidatus Cryosericum odellii]|uniref:tRNA(Ile)-lysidine synthase n=1 Tax=Candidatus Cryosericum odellii TaxID=2290917 RepID=A0A398D4I2_9BACT|nr:tRNA lysidine(34) synthetase TilS [Candidatus Cryosericum odellii]RIE09400.1 tRNA lysidine(34) synthetase TilS [Candidatus Cryosericum odellii]